MNWWIIVGILALIVVVFQIIVILARREKNSQNIKTIDKDLEVVRERAQTFVTHSAPIIQRLTVVKDDFLKKIVKQGAYTNELQKEFSEIILPKHAQDIHQLSSMLWQSYKNWIDRLNWKEFTSSVHDSQLLVIYFEKVFPAGGVTNELIHKASITSDAENDVLSIVSIALNTPQLVKSLSNESVVIILNYMMCTRDERTRTLRVSLPLRLSLFLEFQTSLFDKIEEKTCVFDYFNNSTSDEKFDRGLYIAMLFNHHNSQSYVVPVKMQKDVLVLAVRHVTEPQAFLRDVSHQMRVEVFRELCKPMTSIKQEIIVGVYYCLDSMSGEGNILHSRTEYQHLMIDRISYDSLRQLVNDGEKITNESLMIRLLEVVRYLSLQ